MPENLAILNKKIKNLKIEYKKWEEKNEIDELYLKENLYDILSWIEICENYISEYAKKLDIVSAFLYVNNRKKHDKGVYKITRNTTSIFPSKKIFPSSETYPQKFNIIWKANEVNHGRLNAYKNELKNKEIIKTLDIILELIYQNYTISIDMS